MFRNLKVEGHEGQIKWAYLTAVTFGPFRFEGDDRGGTLTAQIVSCDNFRVNQHPLVAEVPAGRATWRWSVSDLQISGGTLTARVARL
jgi:hypothetical protein